MIGYKLSHTTLYCMCVSYVDCLSSNDDDTSVEWWQIVWYIVKVINDKVVLLSLHVSIVIFIDSNKMLQFN